MTVISYRVRSVAYNMLRDFFLEDDIVKKKKMTIDRSVLFVRLVKIIIIILY